jgi:hypothetical protein
MQGLQPPATSDLVVIVAVLFNLHSAGEKKRKNLSTVMQAVMETIHHVPVF